MLENFVALFNIAEHFKPFLLGDEPTAVKIADPPRQRDSAPSIETIWRAYVCSGSFPFDFKCKLICIDVFLPLLANSSV